MQLRIDTMTNIAAKENATATNSEIRNMGNSASLIPSSDTPSKKGTSVEDAEQDSADLSKEALPAMAEYRSP